MSNTKRPIYSTISLMLILLMAFLLPIQVFAETTPEPKPEESVTFDSLGEAPDNANIVSELKERRDEYTKHFRMDDGTIMAVTYDCPVHYKNDKGKWVEYDNSLIAESEATPDEIVPEPLTNKKSNINIELAPDTKTDNLVKIDSKKGNITWKYTGAKQSNAKVKNNNKKHRGNAKFTSIDKLTSQASYKSIYNNVDLDCIVSTTGVKENIILKNSDAQNEFHIEYNIKGFNAKQVDNKTIQLTNKNGKKIYTISAPYMYDADGNTSTDLSLEIISNKSNVLIVKLIADKGFLSSWGRSYPVTIDPEVTLKSSINIELADTSSAQPNTALNSCSWFSVGTIDNAEHRGLIKCKTLQNYSDKNIVSAKLKIVPDTSTPEMEIEAVPVTSSWTTQNATYNNTALGSEIIDYANTNTDSSNAIAFDLTKYFKKLLSGDIVNNGICLKSNDNGARFGGSENSDSKKVRFEIIYKDYTGLESNLTSHSVPCGQDATFSVCDYTGSLSVKQSFFEENTARLPLSIYATYHSVRNSTNEHTGYGWHYSFNQTISEDNNYYIYKDADGVNSYFKKEDNQSELSDEDELYTLKYDSSNNKIEIDDGDTTKSFEIVDNTNVYKLKIEKSNDNNNNKIQYFYNNAGYMNKITTSLGDYRINRTNDHYICNVQTPNNKYMYFVYYGGTSKMARFTAIDGKASKFYYTSYADEGLLREVRYYNETDSGTMGGGAKCVYNSDNKVSSISELGKNGASRKALSITYNDDNTTEFKEIANNNKKETYTFDNYGNTVSVLNANGMITNANDSSSLSINTGLDSYTKNYIEESNEPNGIGNQQGDGLYFYKGNGIIGNQTSSGGQVTLDSETYLLGHNSIKVNHSGDSQIYTYAMHENNIGTLAGKTVTLSAYVKLSNITAGNLSGGAGALVKFKCLNGNTTLSDKNSVALTQTVKGSEWERLSLTVSIPQATTKFRMYFGIRNAQGTAWFDCMQLEEGSVANDYNALSNSDFSSTNNWKTQNDNAITVNDQKAIINGNGGEPAPTEETTATEEPTSATEEATSATYTRTETETIANDVVEETNAYGNVVKTEQGFVTHTYERTYEVADSNSSSNPEESEDEGEEENEENKNCNNYIYQEVDVNKSNVSFVLSGSAKAQSVPLNNEYRTFGIALKIKYDGDNDYSEEHYQAFNAYTDSMQNISLSVTPNNSGKNVKSVAFAFVYGYNKNKMEIKNAMLNFSYNGTEEGTTETTEPDGTEPESEDTTASEPTSAPEDDRGELIDEVVQEETISTDQPYMRSENAYDDNGNYVTSESDEAGNTTEYERDHDGNATKITDGKGHSTSYSYDVHNNLTSVSQGNSSNSYTYNTYNELSKITHNGFDYNYTYNNYGEPTSVKVGSQALITYEYNSNGNVTKATYGNGDYLDYTYDDYARITKVKLNNTSTLASYKYNKKNQVTKFTDGKSGETTEYCYDCNGNLLYKYLISSGGSLLRVVEGDTEKTTINGSERTITNGTDDDGKSYVQNGKAKITSDTDDFGRTTNVTTKVDNSSKFSVNYSYKNVLDNDNNPTHRTTNNVNQMIYKLGNDETPLVEYSYSYDKNGNITEICEGTNTIAEYKYDSLNQLQECADKNANKYFVYNYNSGGNITSVDIHSLINGMEKGSLERTETYSYATSGWKDKLVSYKNDSIIYDDIGNPTNYRDGIEMSWSGRELKSLTKSGKTYNFTYNLDGLRTTREKKQGNTVLETVNYYYDDSNNLIGLKKGATTVLFYYDSEGKVYSMTKGDDTYFFVKNLQGDVTKIIDENGDTCATYAYDAWGALLAENEDSSVEGFNPFRYRSYVYDTETELYYLQSRYYDPKTGRFINADSPEYTDTDSGSPLSTNMFAYCENNAISGYDPSGKWTLPLHKKLSQQANFKKSVWASTLFADILFSSSPNYSAPFHSRGNLNTVKQLFNAAVDLKYSAYKNDSNNKKKVSIKVCNSNKDPHFSKDGKTYYIPKNALYYRKKGSNDNYCSKIGEIHFYVLSYLNGNIKWDDIKNNKNLSKIKNQIEKYSLQDYLKKNITGQKSQSQALLGLALHALQDFYAHKIMIYYAMNKKSVSGVNIRNRIIKSYAKTYEGNNPISITDFNYYKKYDTKDFEDKKEIFDWRYKYAKKATKKIYDFYYKYNSIKTIEKKEKLKINSIKKCFGEDIICYSKKTYFRMLKIKLEFETLEEIELE